MSRRLRPTCRHSCLVTDGNRVYMQLLYIFMLSNRLMFDVKEIIGGSEQLYRSSLDIPITVNQMLSDIKSKVNFSGSDLST